MLECLLRRVPTCAHTYEFKLVRTSIQSGSYCVGHDMQHDHSTDTNVFRSLRWHRRAADDCLVLLLTYCYYCQQRSVRTHSTCHASQTPRPRNRTDCLADRGGEVRRRGSDARRRAPSGRVCASPMQILWCITCIGSTSFQNDTPRPPVPFFAFLFRG